MIQPDAAQDRLAAEDGQVEGAVVAQEYCLIHVISRDDFGIAAADGQRIADFHGHCGLHVALAGAWNALRRQQGTTENERPLQLLIAIAVAAAIVIGQRVEVELAYQLLLRNRDGTRMIQLVIGNSI